MTKHTTQIEYHSYFLIANVVLYSCNHWNCHPFPSLWKCQVLHYQQWKPFDAWT